MPKQYVHFPGAEYPGDTTAYPYSVGTVDDDVTEVVSPRGSTWRIVTEGEMYEMSDALQACIGSTERVAGEMEIPLDKLVESRETLTVDLAVVKELWTRIMRADHGEFLSVAADLIAANSIKAEHLEVGVLDGQVVTGATVRTSDTFPRLEMTSSGLRAFDSNGKVTTEIDTDGEVTITSGTFRTSASSTRTEMSSAEGLRVLKNGTPYFRAHHDCEFGAEFFEPLSGTLRSPSEVIFGAKLFEFSGKKTCTAALSAAGSGGWTQWDFNSYGFYAPCDRAVVIASCDYTCGGGTSAGARVAITLRFKPGAGSTDVPQNGWNEMPVLDSGHGTVYNDKGDSDGPHTATQASQYCTENPFGMLPTYSGTNLVLLKKGYWYWPRIQMQLVNTSGSGMTNAQLAAASWFGNARLTMLPC